MSNGIFMLTGPYEQWHFYANKAKNKDAPLSSERQQTRYMPVKPDRTKNPRHGQHPERDQNEIGTRYEFA